MDALIIARWQLATKAQAMTKKILSACELTEKVLPSVQTIPKIADMVKLKASTGEVQKMTKSLQALMPSTAKSR